jgi:sigma-B regulation protein RsbU (phosphoserine phosphatase)
MKACSSGLSLLRDIIGDMKTDMGDKKIRSVRLTDFVVKMIAFNAIILGGLILAVSYLFFYRQITEVYDDVARAITGEAATQLDNELIKRFVDECDSILSSVDDPLNAYNNDRYSYLKHYKAVPEEEDYIKMQRFLEDLRKGTEATEIGFVIMYPEREYGIYVMDARDVAAIHCGEMFEVSSKNFDKKTKLFKGFYSRSKYFGILRTDGVLIYADKSAGVYAYLTADIPTSKINDRFISFIISSTLAAIILAIVVCLLIAYFIKKNMVKPIMHISDLAEKYAEGYEERSLKHEDNIKLVFGDIPCSRITEANDLLSSMQKMELEINSYIKNLDTVTREQERIRIELDTASAIQAAMLPDATDPFPGRDEFEIFASAKAAKEVGGDFYDFFLIDEDHLGLVIADVSGKGVPAALFMMACKIIIKNLAIAGLSPSKTLMKANEQICSNNKEGMFVTVWFGILSIKEKKLVASSAGHEYPFIKKGDRFDIFKDPHGIILGGMEGVKYKDYEIELEKGDTILVYTDGVVEATDKDKKMFGSKRLLESLNKEPNLDPKALIGHVIEDVNAFVGDEKQFDDLTMMCIRID